MVQAFSTLFFNDIWQGLAEDKHLKGTHLKDMCYDENGVYIVYIYTICTLTILGSIVNTIKRACVIV